MKKTFISFVLGIACVLAIAAVRQPFYAAGPLMIQTGSSIVSTDGTVTNAFATAYTTAPKVVVTHTGTLISTTNDVVSVTTSNFVFRSSLASTTNNWIAVGTP